MADVRVALAGFGRFARVHARAYTAIPGCRVVAVCDPSAEARQAARELLPDVALYENLPALLDGERDLDAVDVLSDESSHGPQALMCLDRGLGVFVEKPLATDVAQAREIERRSAELGLPVVVGYVSRFDARYALVRRAIELGDLGRVAAITARRGFSRSWFDGFGSRVHPVFESMIHDIDLAVWFLDAPIKTVYAQQLATEGDVADVLSAILTAQDGRLVSLQSAWLVPAAATLNLPAGPHDPLDLLGTIEAEIEVTGTAGTARVALADGPRITTDQRTISTGALWPEVHGRVEGALRSELEHFLACVRERRASELVPVAQSVAAVEIAGAIVRSARTGLPVDLSAPD
jgi:predicted dehydrogenase